jgi:uncharacterized protein YqgC (DUF456 family)
MFLLVITNKKLEMDIFILIISIVLVFVGLILIIVNFPGIWLVWLGILVHSAYNGFSKVSVLTIIIMFFLSLLSAVIDYIAIGYSSKKFGASKWGIVGAIIGGMLGAILGNIIGLLIGPFIGALIAEAIFAGKNFDASSKAGLGAILGIFLGITFDLGFAISMVIVWVWMAK